jgi:hypothetical protein
MPEFRHLTDEQVRKIKKTVTHLPGPTYGSLEIRQNPNQLLLLRDKDNIFGIPYSIDDDETWELVPLEIVLDCLLQGRDRKIRWPTDIQRKKALTRFLKRIEAIIADLVVARGRALVFANSCDEEVALLKQAANIVVRDLKRVSEKPLKSQSRLNAAKPHIDECLEDLIDVWKEIGGDLLKRKPLLAFLQATAETRFGEMSLKAIGARLDRLGIFRKTTQTKG